METKQSAIRQVLFGVFFTLGAAVVCLAALIGDVMQYYSSRQQLVWVQRRVELLEKLNSDYEALLDRMQEDPNLVKRTAPVILGIRPQEPDTAYPTAWPEELLAAQQALFVADEPPQGPPAMPGWLVRCSQTGTRRALFWSGAGMVVVAFICFGPQWPSRTK